MATENPYVDAISVLKETTVTAGSRSNYTNVTMATENPYVDAMYVLKETTGTIAGSGESYTNVTMATVTDNIEKNDRSGSSSSSLPLTPVRV